MKKIILFVVMAVAVISFADCGSTFVANQTPSPPPPGQTVTDVQADTQVSFLQYTVLGLPDAGTTASIRVSGDLSSRYSINGGAPTNAPGSVKNSDVVVVRNTSSNFGPNLPISTTLFIGLTNATYTSITGAMVFPTIKGIRAGLLVDSNTATIPTALPNGFIFGNPTIISFTPDSDPSSLMFINGSSIPAASPSPIAAGNTISFRHTGASVSGQTVTTKAVITGSNNVSYPVSFKSTTL